MELISMDFVSLKGLLAVIFGFCFAFCCLVLGLFLLLSSFTIPDSKVHGANMGLTWVLSAPDGPHVGPMNLAIRDVLLIALLCIVTTACGMEVYLIKTIPKRSTYVLIAHYKVFLLVCIFVTWWFHDMKNAFCITGTLWCSSVDSHHKGPANRNLDVFIVVNLNHQWNKHFNCRWFETS